MKSPLLMGVLNLTPDSFSDGGRYNTLEKAKNRIREMEKQGAHIIDIGGESTGPNSEDISLDEELSRIIPLLKQIRDLTNLPISIDTYKSKVAQEALKLGANIINDITGLRHDTSMAKTIADHNAKIVIMHCKDKTPRTTIKALRYKDVIKSIKTFLLKQIRYAEKNKINKKNIIIDPGFGHFISAIPRYSFEIISNLNSLCDLNCPILIGISRKSFLGGTMTFRDQRSLPATAIAYINGASIIRTHNIKATKEFFDNFNK